MQKWTRNCTTAAVWVFVTIAWIINDQLELAAAGIVVSHLYWLKD